jgi:hypothetical protein
LESWVRREATIEANDLISVPEQKLTSIATSNAQSDAGIFELSFRDERYLPFEGAGAISNWRLELPSKIHSFDYETISDVIVHISYTAKDGDSEFRTEVENHVVAILSEIAAEKGLFRLISLRHEFPNNFHQLLHPNTGQPQITEFDLEKRHFPYFIADKELELSSAVKVYLKPKKKDGDITSGLSVKINGVDASTPWKDFGENMKLSDVSIIGTPVTKWKINAEGLDEEEIDDLLILLTYTASSPS